MTTSTVEDNWKKQLNTFLSRAKTDKINENKINIKQAKSKADNAIKIAKKSKDSALKANNDAARNKTQSEEKLRTAKDHYGQVKEDKDYEKAKLEQVKKDIASNMALIRQYNNAVNITKQFRITWKDRKSGAKLSAAFYRPIPTNDYIALGDYGQSNYGRPNGSILTIKRNGPIKWKHPVSFTRIWKDSGSGASWDGSFWRPNPPKGYVAVGMCCQRGHGRPPNVTEIACIRADFAERCTPKSIVWNDRKSGANRDVSVYYNDKVGTIYVQANYRTPANNCFWTLNDKALIPTLKPIPAPKRVASKRAAAKTISASSKLVFKAIPTTGSKVTTASLAKTDHITVDKHKITITKMNAILAKLEKESKRV